MRVSGRTPAPGGGKPAAEFNGRRSIPLRPPFKYGAFLVIGVSIGAAGDAPVAIALLGAATAGGALLMTGGSADNAETIDHVGRREISRARRCSRPVTLASIAGSKLFPGEGDPLAAVLARSVRETDIVGHAGGRRVLVLFADTAPESAAAAWERLRADVGDLASELRVGMASFPDDNPTWEGLKALALEREQPAVSHQIDVATWSPDGAVASHGA